VDYRTTATNKYPTVFRGKREEVERAKLEWIVLQ